GRQVPAGAALAAVRRRGMAGTEDEARFLHLLVAAGLRRRYGFSCSGILATIPKGRRLKMAYENILVEREGPIATITVNRPKSLNALNSATLRELTQAVRESVDSCRAFILTGSGDRAFVAGADIAEMAPMTPWTAREFSELGHVLTALLEDIPVATIAAVNGYALGGGLELAVACDMIYAS